MDELRAIARRVMRERGLLPDFSRAVRDEANAIHGPARANGTSIRDLRSLLWASIDNDDSRDLDQLTVAQSHPDGTATIFVAVADVGTRRAGSAIGHARTNTTSVYGGRGVFHAAGELRPTSRPR
jgi:exoribonuclease-2